ncbi:MAG: cbb3-type cytochrome c oxidase subunit 3 [Verrucomicrobia bacterium]|nr:cbb3-type cytochrome c oxidase subunit 3 [Verrucomicrobiota bacterium]MCH8528671.1 cbb3-type cytochrome c oxidase subunit 3 [Kiritimatiellia bacterium]
MHKEVLRAIEGIGLYPVISLIVFFLFFTSVFLWVVRIRKSHAKSMAAMPLDDGDTPEPLSTPSSPPTTSRS